MESVAVNLICSRNGGDPGMITPESADSTGKDLMYTAIFLRDGSYPATLKHAVVGWLRVVAVKKLVITHFFGQSKRSLCTQSLTLATKAVWMTLTISRTTPFHRQPSTFLNMVTWQP